MNYLKREIDSILKEWIEKRRGESIVNKVLLIMGLRQVGKTESIRNALDRFVPEGAYNRIDIDFERDPSLSDAFDGFLSPKDVLQKISIVPA